MSTDSPVKEVVRQKCGAAAQRVSQGASGIQQLAAQVDGKFASGFIRATKPVGAKAASVAGVAGAAAAGAADTAAHAAAEPAPASASCCGPRTCCGS